MLASKPHTYFWGEPAHMREAQSDGSELRYSAINRARKKAASVGRVPTQTLESSLSKCKHGQTHTHTL